MKSEVFALFFLYISVALCASSWQFIDRDYEFRCAGVSFYNESNGWMAGIEYLGYDPLLLHTSDGGKTYDNDPYIDAAHGGFVAVYFEDSMHGLASGEDFLKLSPCAVMTTNGQNWTTVKGREFICTAQSVQVLESGQVYVMAAQWIELFEIGDGIQISTDGGSNWNSRNWGIETEARYVSCVSSTTCFIAGGTWAFPTVYSKKDILLRRLSGESIEERYFTHHLKMNKNGELMEVLDSSFEKVNISAFQAIVALTTDSGKSWQVVFNASAQGLYFNQISCPDANHCWVVGSGVISEFNSTRAAWIYATTDGGQTWTEQLHWNSYSLINIQMLNTTYGWAAGTQLLTPTEWQGIFLLTTDGGNTWVQSGVLSRFSPLNLSVVDPNYAYAAGFTSPSDFSSLVGYIPS